MTSEKLEFVPPKSDIPSKSKKRSRRSDGWQENVYKEDASGIHLLSDTSSVGSYMKKHGKMPYGTTREVGYFFIQRPELPKVIINPSMLKEDHRVDEDGSRVVTISRIDEAPKFPVSCIAASEHLVAMGDKVTNFVSETEPEAKKKVMYQVLVRINMVLYDVESEIKRLLDALLKFDKELARDSISIRFDATKDVLVVEVGTQVGDIQKIIQGIRSLRYFHIVKPAFSDIVLNDAICFINKEDPSQLHVLANIADSPVDKCFLDRDVGATSSGHVATYQDNHWIMNSYTSLEQIAAKRNMRSYDAIRLFKRADPSSAEILDKEDKTDLFLRLGSALSSS